MRVLRHAGVRRPDARGAASLTPLASSASSRSRIARAAAGQKTSAAPVKARALAAGLPVLQPERLKDPAFLDEPDGLGADLGVVAAYGKILTDAVLATPRLGLLNVHASLLPRYRGAAPVHRAVIAGERETGVTIMRVVKALDAGPMLAAVRRPIGPDETSEEVERDLARLGAELLVSTADDLAAGRSHETPQDESAATYAHRLTKDDGVIDWSWPADRVHDLDPRPAPLAARVHVSQRAPPDSATIGSRRGRRRTQTARHDSRGVRRRLWSSRPATGRLRPD